MKKSRMFFVLLLVCSILAGCAEKSAEIPAETMQEIAADWAEGLRTRDGELRYQHMSEELQKAFVEERKEIYGDNWNYVIGWSSPWVTSYEVETEKNTGKRFSFSLKKSMDRAVKITDSTASSFQHFVENLAESRKRTGKIIEKSQFINIFNRVFNGGTVKIQTGKELQKVYEPCT